MNQILDLIKAQSPRYLLRILMLSVFEVVVIVLLFFLTKPYFASYQVFWYLLCLIMVPACACSVAVNGLTKIASQVMVQAKHLNITITDTNNEKLVTSAWQYISWKKVLVMVSCGVLIAICYSESAKSFTDLLVLFIAIIIATFACANWVIINASVPMSVAVYKSYLVRRRVSNDTKTIDHCIRFHLLPWAGIASATLLTFFVKYYLGLADESGYVETGYVIGSSYISGVFVAVWLWLEVGQMARLDHILGRIHLAGIGHVTGSEAFSLIMFVPIGLVMCLAAFNGFFDIESYRYQTAIIMSVLLTLLCALMGVSVAILKLCASRTLKKQPLKEVADR